MYLLFPEIGLLENKPDYTIVLLPFYKRKIQISQSQCILMSHFKLRLISLGVKKNNTFVLKRIIYQNIGFKENLLFIYRILFI